MLSSYSTRIFGIVTFAKDVYSNNNWKSNSMYNQYISIIFSYLLFAKNDDVESFGIYSKQ